MAILMKELNLTVKKLITKNNRKTKHKIFHNNFFLSSGVFSKKFLSKTLDKPTFAIPAPKVP